MRAFISILIACAMLSGCATAYEGPHPDFSKTGAGAKAEYEKFEFGESYGDVNLYAATMGKKSYYVDTVDPIAKEVSPAWTTRLNKMKVAEYVSWGILAATLATIFMPQDSWGHQTGYWIGLGALLGTGIYINVTGIHAAVEYNQDLKSKFTPALAVSKIF